MHCSNCGKEVAEGARFCNHCGAEISGSGSQAAAAPRMAAPVSGGAGTSAQAQLMQAKTVLQKADGILAEAETLDREAELWNDAIWHGSSVLEVYGLPKIVRDIAIVVGIPLLISKIRGDNPFKWLIPIVLIYFVYYYTTFKRKAGVYSKQAQLRRDSVEGMIASDPALQFLPSAYRNTEAVDYMLELFQYNRVSTINEALNAWDLEHNSRIQAFNAMLSM